MKQNIKYGVFSVLSWCLVVYPESCYKAFSSIYQRHEWGSNQDNSGSSGSGSSVRNTVAYRLYLQDFLEQHNIKSVVDLGCGDWNFSQYINWTGISYLGIDVVPELIAKNDQIFATSTIHFACMDALTQELPPADLLICKDVLQHLPNEYILQLISQFKKYKYCLITDNMDVIQNGVLYTKDHSVNEDIPAIGCCRPIDITKSPFNISGNCVLQYLSTAFIMQTVLIDNSQ